MDITKTEKYNIRKCEPFSEIEFVKKMNELSENYQNDYDCNCHFRTWITSFHHLV